MRKIRKHLKVIWECRSIWLVSANFFSVQRYFLDGTCFSELCGSYLFSDFFLVSQAPTTSITNAVFLPYLCSQETVSNLSANGHCWWNLPGPDKHLSVTTSHGHQQLEENLKDPSQQYGDQKGKLSPVAPSSEHTFNSCQICSLRSIFVLFFMGRVENRPGFLLILNSKKPSTCHDFFTFASYHSPESAVTSFRSSQQCARGKRQAWTRSMFNWD